MPDLSRFIKNGNYYYFGDAPIHISGIALDKSSITLTTVGQTEQLTATISPADAVETKVVWSSSDETIATVSQTGLVTCVTPGECTITATCGGYSASCSVSESRTPGANTWAYRPLKSSRTTIDESGNGRNLGINSYVTVGTYQGVDCCYFNTRGSLTLNTTSLSSSHTILVWVYGNNSGSYKYIFYTPATYEGCYFTINSSQYGLATQKPSSGSISTITGLSSSDLTQWSLLALVRNGTEYTTYLINQNGTKKQASTGNSSAAVSGRLVIGNYDTNDSSGSILGGLSEFIIETSIWSEQDILDYYNSTKSNYGIS